MREEEVWSMFFTGIWNVLNLLFLRHLQSVTLFRLWKHVLLILNVVVEWCVYWQALMLKQEQEDLLEEQRKLEQAVSFLLLFLSEHTVFTLKWQWYGTVTLLSSALLKCCNPLLDKEMFWIHEKDFTIVVLLVVIKFINFKQRKPLSCHCLELRSKLA